MKATELLKQQHREVERTFAEIESGREDVQELVDDLALDLAAHAAIEQQIFYPTVRSIDPRLIDESYEEHSMVELALKRLLQVVPEDTHFVARLNVLKDLVMAHVDQEEEELFPAVEDVFDAKELEAVGALMQKQYAEAKSEGFDSLVPEGFARTSADEFETAVEKAFPHRPQRAGAPS